MVGVYFAAQPVAAILAAAAVIAATEPPHRGLRGPGFGDLGALAIFAGVSMLIYDAHVHRRATTTAAAGPPSRGGEARAEARAYRRLADGRA